MKDGKKKSSKKPKTSSVSPTKENVKSPLKSDDCLKEELTNDKLQPDTSNGFDIKNNSSITVKNVIGPTPTNKSNEVTDVVIEGESYCIISNTDDESAGETKSQPKDAHAFTLEDSVLKSDDEESPAAEQTQEEPKATFKRKCKITCVTIMSDEKEGNTYVVAGVKIKSKKTRKSKVKIKNKLSLLVYKVAGKVKIPSDSEPSHGGIDNFFGEDYSPMAMPLNDVYDQLAEGYDVYDVPHSIDALDVTNSDHLAVIDEYLMAAQKNPSANSGTQNISLFNEVKSGFDQEEIVKVDDIKTVYEDCVFHKCDIDRTFYDIFMLISDLIVVGNFLVVVLKHGKTQEQVDVTKTVLLVFSIVSSKKQITEIKLINSRTIFGTLIKDAINVSCSNIPPSILGDLITLEQFEGMDNQENTEPSPQSLLLIALGDNSLSFMTVPKLTEKKMLTELEKGTSIHKIAYCGPLSSVAICDNMGYLHIQSCLDGNEERKVASSIEKYGNFCFCLNQSKYLFFKFFEKYH